ncbi:MAG TPA: undecaprenyl-diphosphate phosphatase [Bacteroidales bacterium]|nr:undecaprenyl-diphosphate phosphatase [Bacteroidales bacterium]HPT20983.1 undecaprenyl-diphosphate phosphatase [Bacteroidales bacterium]
MDWFEAVILGLIQGLTEFLPVSSSGHLELGKFLFGIDPESNFYFSVAVHGATVLSTIVVLWKEILDLFKGFFKFRLNEETKYVIKIIISMIPVGITGLFLNDIIEEYFAGNMISLGIQFIITALLLLMPLFIRPKEKQLGYVDSFIIGIAQAIAVLPAISRSGATIATGMMLGNKKSDIAKFSFIMVLIPIIGANLVELKSGNFSTEGTAFSVILIGFITAFVSGYFACKWMINLVKKGNLSWFAVYCVLVGVFSILLGLHVI